MKTICFLFVLICTSATHAGVCQRLLGYSNKPKFSRSYKQFPEEVLLRYQAMRESLLSDSHGQIEPSQNTANSMHVLNLINELALASGLQTSLNNPAAIIVNIYDSKRPDEIPRADMEAGILSINTRMIDVVVNDDELAAVVGHEFLHHSLAHGLQLLKMKERYWFHWMSGRSNVDAFPLIRAPNFFRSILEWRVESVRDAQEHEVDRALPDLLINAGFDPWAIVDLYERLLEIIRSVPPIIMDGYTRQKVQKRTDMIRADLLTKGLQPSQSRASTRVQQLDRRPK
jgi:hypothetical protein